MEHDTQTGDQQRFEALLRARHPCIFIPTHEEDEALQFVHETVFRQSYRMRLWSVVNGICDGKVKDLPPAPETEHPAAALYYLQRQADHTITVFLDLVDHLDDARTMRLLRDLIRHCAQSASHVVLIDHRDELPPVIAGLATRMELSLPDGPELEEIVRQTLRRCHQEQRIRVDINRSAYQAVLRNLAGLSRRQVEQLILETVVDDRRFDSTDINTILARKRELVQSGGLLQYVQAPVALHEIGGLRRLKAWLERRRFALTDEAEQFGLSAPRGVLMLGVQGAGKSFCAKAIATAWQRPLLRMDVGALYDRYIGESERRLRDALHQAERMAPIVLWIDEIEKAFASAASRSTDGGLSQRMFGALLTWMQEHRAPVFLVATANDIEALPPEMLRKGRVDEIFFVDLPTEETRRQIFSIHLAKRNHDPAAFDLDALARAAEGFSGAEIEQAIIAALHDAFAARRKLDTQQVLAALRVSPPLSVTMAERVGALRAWAQHRCIPAD